MAIQMQYQTTKFVPVAATLAAAVRIFTINGAIVGTVGKSSGSTEAGKDADFIVLDRNIFEVPIADVGQTLIVLSVVNGNTIIDNR